MSARKKKTTRKKAQRHIPDEFIDLWNKDYRDLDESQRIKMSDVYISLAEDYESGCIEKIEPPFFMTQGDVAAEEMRLKKQKLLEEKKATEEEEKAKREILDEALCKWQKESLVVLSKAEQLEVENYNLKIHIVEIKTKEWEDKKKELIKKQEELIEELAEKYEVNVEDYIVDPIKGIFVRNPEIKFPYSLDDMPSK